MTVRPIQPGTYQVTGPDGKYLFDVVVRPDGSHRVHHVGEARCTVCQQRVGDDCVHFTAKDAPRRDGFRTGA